MAAAAETQCLSLAVKVVSGCKVLFGSKIISCSEQESFGGLLSRLEEERFAQTQVLKIFIQDASSPVPLFSRAGRRAVRFARGRKKKGLVSTVCACAGFSWNSVKQ